MYIVSLFLLPGIIVIQFRFNVLTVVSLSTSCCVDEVAAEHVGADCIVHYGSACLSPSKRLPLMYVFDRRPLDLKKCASSFREFYTDRQSHVIVLYDVNYAHIIGKYLEPSAAISVQQ